MKVTKQQWMHVAYLDGKEIYRQDKPFTPLQMQELTLKYNARFIDNFDLEHRPEICYRFRTVK